MGVDYYAYAFIGQKINKNKLNKEVTVPGCNHKNPKSNTFCPECGKRLRYRATQAGHKGMCPRCRAGWDFPPLPEKKKK